MRIGEFTISNQLWSDEVLRLRTLASSHFLSQKLSNFDVTFGVGSRWWSDIVSLARRAMPTVHYVKREFLEENDLTIPWKIDVELDIQADPSHSTGRKCAACTSDLKRKSDDIIWIRVGRTDHPAYEMIRSRNNSCTTHPIDPDDMMWIEWANTGKFEGISKQQILKDGLQPRKRKRPN